MSRPTSARKRASAQVPAKPERVSETLIDENIPADPEVEKMLEPYSAKVRELEVLIGKLDGELRKGSVGAGNLGNFVADGIRAQSSARLGKPVPLAVSNSGGLRKNTIAAGDLRAADIFELLPFENALIAVDLTGQQVLRLLAIVTGARDAQSGARVRYRTNAENAPELVSAVLIDKDGREIPIDPKGTYTIVTIDYLLKLASGKYSMLQEGKNVTPLSVTIRDAMLDYVKAEAEAGRSIKAELDGRFASVDTTGPESKSE